MDGIAISTSHILNSSTLSAKGGFIEFIMCKSFNFIYGLKEHKP